MVDIYDNSYTAYYSHLSADTNRPDVFDFEPHIV